MTKSFQKAKTESVVEDDIAVRRAIDARGRRQARRRLHILRTQWGEPTA